MPVSSCKEVVTDAEVTNEVRLSAFCSSCVECWVSFLPVGMCRVADDLHVVSVTGRRVRCVQVRSQAGSSGPGVTEQPSGHVDVVVWHIKLLLLSSKTTITLSDVSHEVDEHTHTHLGHIHTRRARAHAHTHTYTYGTHTHTH